MSARSPHPEVSAAIERGAPRQAAKWRLRVAPRSSPSRARGCERFPHPVSSPRSLRAPVADALGCGCRWHYGQLLWVLSIRRCGESISSSRTGTGHDSSGSVKGCFLARLPWVNEDGCVHASTVMGLVLALGSTVLISFSYLREHGAVEGLPALSLRRPLRSARLLLNSRAWLLGFAMESAGFGLYVVALALAPLALVQSVAAGGVGVLAVASARVAHRRLTHREVMGASLAVGGLVLLAVSLSGVNRAQQQADGLGPDLLTSDRAALAIPWWKQEREGRRSGCSCSSISICADWHAWGSCGLGSLALRRCKGGSWRARRCRPRSLSVETKSRWRLDSRSSVRQFERRSPHGVFCLLAKLLISSPMTVTR